MQEKTLPERIRRRALRKWAEPGKLVLLLLAFKVARGIENTRAERLVDKPDRGQE